MAIDKTVYKNVMVGSIDGALRGKPYKRVMNEVGKCLQAGGWVEYEHHWMRPHKDSPVHDYVDVTLYRNVNT